MVKLNINTINKGSLPRLFDQAFKEVMKDIAAKGTQPGAKREIKIKVTVIPSEKKDGAIATVEVETKLAKRVSAGSMSFDYDGSKLTALTPEYEQSEIPFTKIDDIAN